MSIHVNAKIAHDFIERAEALGLKGKKRDDAALEYVLGAVSALYAVGETANAEHLARLAAMLISVRGYAEIRNMAGLEHTS